MPLTVQEAKKVLKDAIDALPEDEMQFSAEVVPYVVALAGCDPTMAVKFDEVMQPKDSDAVLRYVTACATCSLQVLMLECSKKVLMLECSKKN